MGHLEIRNLHCSYGADDILKSVDLSVDRGEVVSLIGPSGSGKSTLLRSLIGLTPPRLGTVELDGEGINYRNRQSLRHLRDKMAIVFQQYNLFQNMNVFRNVTVAPLKIKKRDKGAVEKTATELLDRVGIGDKHEAYPDELSGGQQQRVAIARALALAPEILLLDEVTSALDPERVNEVLDVIRDLTRDGITMLIVSHEMSFVKEVSTRVAMMDAGSVVEVGPPEQIFDAPKEQRTRDFVGKILRH